MSSEVFDLVTQFRNGMRVKRYHTLDLVVGETVGHHSCGVALVLYAIHPHASAQLLYAALTHDLAEQLTGDVPATAKWKSPALAKALEELEESLHPTPRLSPFEALVLKQADLLDLCFKAMEEINMGNSTMKVVLSRGLHYLRTHDPLINTLRLIEDIEYELQGE